MILCYHRLKKLLQYNLDHEPLEYYVFDKDLERKKVLYRENAKEYARNNKERLAKERENETPEEREIRLQKNRDYQNDRRKRINNGGDESSLYEKERKRKASERSLKWYHDNKDKVKERNALKKNKKTDDGGKE